MKKEIPVPAVVGIIALIIVIAAAVMFWPSSKPASPEAAGLGQPALPGGETRVDPSKGPGGASTP